MIKTVLDDLFFDHVSENIGKCKQIQVGDILFPNPAFVIGFVDDGHKGLFRRGQEVVRHAGTDGAVIDLSQDFHIVFTGLLIGGDGVDGGSLSHDIPVGPGIKEIAVSFR